MDDSFSRDKILSIPENEPERLFGSPVDIAVKYRRLVKIWHPDAGGDSDVFARLSILYRNATIKIEKNIWRKPDVFEFTCLANKTYNFNYKKQYTFELGQIFLSRNMLVFNISPEHCPALSDPTHKLLSNLKFADAKMREVIGRDLPRLRDFKKLKDGGAVFVFHKSEKLIRLRELQEYFGGKIPGPHAAWITSRLLSHAVYFEWAGLTHNDISLDTVFINPEDHTASLLGGWWYAAPVDSILSYLPSRTVSAGPASLKINKKATTRTDSELIKLLVREMLGPKANVEFPEIFKWSLSHQSMKALDSLKHWSETVLPAAFGPKKFVPLEVAAEKIYSF